MAPKRKVPISRPERPIRKKRTVRRGGSSSQAPSSSELRSKQREDPALGNVSSQATEREEEVVREEVEPELPIRYFGSEHARIRFYERYSRRKLHEARTVDFAYFSAHLLKIEEWIAYQGWVDLLQEEQIMYPTLAKIFHCNFNGDNFTSYVKGERMEFGATKQEAFETLGNILGVPFEEEEVPEEITIAHILNELSGSNHHTSATHHIKATSMGEEARILRAILADAILPKVGSKDSVTQKEAELIWKLMHYKKINLPKEVFAHIIACNTERSNISLPYGSWLTGVFKFFTVVIRNESNVVLSTKRGIGKTSIKQMANLNVLAIKARREALAAEEGRGDRDETFHERDQSGSQNHGAEAHSFHTRPQTPPSHPQPPSTSAPVSEPTQLSTIISMIQSLQSFVTSKFSDIESDLQRMRFKMSTLENNQHTILRMLHDTQDSTSSSSHHSQSPTIQPSPKPSQDPPT